MKKKISVIVPVYKVEQYLDRCMRSLLAQTLTDIEIILVDDGSPDRCPEMCDAYALQDPRIRVIHKKNGGLGYARNSGLEIAQGEYIAFLDSDDYVAVDMYEKMYAAAKEYDADVVLAGINTVGGILFGDKAEIKQTHCFRETELFVGAEGRRKLLQGFIGAAPEEKDDSRYDFAVWKNIYRGDMIRDHQVRFCSEREIAAEDLMFQLSVIPFVNRAVGIPGAYSYYCHNGASLSKSYRPDRFERCMHVVSKVEERMPTEMTPADYRLNLDRHIQAHARYVSIQEIFHARECGMSAKDLRKRLQAINRHPVLAQTLRRYPWWKLPPMQAMFAFTMRFQLPSLACVMVTLKEKLR